MRLDIADVISVFFCPLSLPVTQKLSFEVSLLFSSFAFIICKKKKKDLKKTLIKSSAIELYWEVFECL